MGMNASRPGVGDRTMRPRRATAVESVDTRSSNSSWSNQNVRSGQHSEYDAVLLSIRTSLEQHQCRI